MPSKKPESSRAVPQQVQKVADTITEKSLTVSRSFSSSPIPPASEYAGYEAAKPGAGDRALAYAENEQTFRHQELPRHHAASMKERAATRKYVFIAILAIFVICEATAGWCAYLGLELPAAVIGAIPFPTSAVGFWLLRKFFIQE